MIDLYAAGTSNGMRARIAVEECGLAYRFHPIDIQKGEQKLPGLLAMNPMGQIPVLIDDEGPGGKPLTLSQSTAILVYCAEKSGRFLPRDPAARAAMLQALMSASTDVTPMLGALFTVIRSKDPHGPTADLFRGRVRGYFKVWDDYLAAERYKRVHEEISRLQAAAGGALSEDLMQQAQTARAEMEAVRRAVARVKVEFNSGKRY